MRLGLIIAAVSLVLDQISKAIFVDMLRPEGVTETPFYSDTLIEVLPFFNLQMAWNTGISFSMFNSGGAMTYVLLAVQIAITGALLCGCGPSKTR